MGMDIVHPKFDFVQYFLCWEPFFKRVPNMKKEYGYLLG